MKINCKPRPPLTPAELCESGRGVKSKTKLLKIYERNDSEGNA